MLRFIRTDLHRSLLLVLALTAFSRAGNTDTAIDWDKARSLHQRSQKGETLTGDEQAYLERAKAARGAQGPGKGAERGKGPAQGGPAGGQVKMALQPLTEMGDSDRYKGQDGGLYGSGLNNPPPAHLESALKMTATVQPLDAQGKPAAGGKTGLISIGMSNTTREFSTFVERANADPERSAAVTIVDGAQGGMAGRDWADSDNRFRRDRPGPWETLDQRIQAAGLTSNQVQAAWIKQAERNPGQLGDFPRHSDVLADSLAKIVVGLKARFPNLKLVYFSSRLYAGFANSALNPEPYAYEGAFAVRQVIRKQMEKDPVLGAPGMPVLLWGPYLWANGNAGRKSDGLVYERADFAGDGTHPSASGSEKVAGQLLTFFKTDPTARSWFVKKP